MAKYFTMDEMTRSSTALLDNIDNTPTVEAAANLTRLMDLLDKVRERWGEPIHVNSGYRSEALNRRVGGAASSQHLKGEAADITVGSPIKNKSLFANIVEMQANGEIEFDQLIDERDYSWIHISLKQTNNRNQILSL